MLVDNPFQGKPTLHKLFAQTTCTYTFSGVLFPHALILVRMGDLTMFAHIFKTRTPGVWQLLITTGPHVNVGIVESLTYTSKQAAKQAAARFNAKAWNY